MRIVKDAVVLITGSSRGLGRAIAEEFARGGANVVVNYSKSRGQAEEVVAYLKASGAADAIAIQADVSQPEQASRLVQETIKRFGRLDLLVNNAGINIDRTIKSMSVEDWKAVLDTDLSSAFYTIKAALPQFIEQKSGAIINMGSAAGEAGNFGQANYSAAKAGLLGLTKTAALELARYNVTVDAICAGPVANTDMWERIPAEVKPILLSKIPLSRPADIEDVVSAARYLYEHGEYVTGTSLNVNGGFYLG